MYDKMYHGDHVTRVMRNIHGLKDATWIWRVLITERIRNVEREELASVPSIYKEEDMLLICYVDDILVLAEEQKHNAQVKQH